jgi:hypothetical protein
MARGGTSAERAPASSTARARSGARDLAVHGRQRNRARLAARPELGPAAFAAVDVSGVRHVDGPVRRGEDGRTEPIGGRPRAHRVDLDLGLEQLREALLEPLAPGVASVGAVSPALAVTIASRISGRHRTRCHCRSSSSRSRGPPWLDGTWQMPRRAARSTIDEDSAGTRSRGSVGGRSLTIIDPAVRVPVSLPPSSDQVFSGPSRASTHAEWLASEANGTDGSAR